MVRIHYRIYQTAFLLFAINLYGCGGPPEAVSEVPIDGVDHVSQFADLAPVGPNLIWVVTSRGELMSVSKEGQQRKADIESANINNVTFIDDTQGWAVDRRSRIWSTSDGGESWNLVHTPPKSDTFYLPQQLIFVDQLNGWLIGVFRIWRTVDGGKTWTERFSVAAVPEDRVGRLYRGAFFSANHGWVSGSGGVVFQTADGGETWKPRFPVSERTDLHDVSFTGEHKGWLVGRPDGGIYFTEDGGTTWRRQFESEDRIHLNSLSFVDGIEGWASGWLTKSSEVREGVIFHTTNGGERWSSLSNTPKDSLFLTVKFSDKQNGWLAGRDTIYRTEDGGSTWQIVLRLPVSKEN